MPGSVGQPPETGSPAAVQRLPVPPLSSTQLAINLDAHLSYPCLSASLNLSYTWLGPGLDVAGT